MLSQRRSWVRVYAGALLGICLGAGTILAQVTATVSGRVDDSSGAILPGVTVSVTSLETGAVRTGARH